MADHQTEDRPQSFWMLYIQNLGVWNCRQSKFLGKPKFLMHSKSGLGESILSNTQNQQSEQNVLFLLQLRKLETCKSSSECLLQTHEETDHPKWCFFTRKKRENFCCENFLDIVAYKCRETAFCKATQTTATLAAQRSSKQITQHHCRNQNKLSKKILDAVHDQQQLYSV